MVVPQAMRMVQAADRRDVRTVLLPAAAATFGKLVVRAGLRDLKVDGVHSPFGQVDEHTSFWPATWPRQLPADACSPTVARRAKRPVHAAYADG